MHYIEHQKKAPVTRKQTKQQVRDAVLNNEIFQLIDATIQGTMQTSEEKNTRGPSKMRWCARAL